MTPMTVVTDDEVERVARALQEADLHDGDEGNHYRLFDLLGFSGENKSVMITRQLAHAALSASDRDVLVALLRDVLEEVGDWNTPAVEAARTALLPLGGG